MQVNLICGKKKLIFSSKKKKEKRKANQIFDGKYICEIDKSFTSHFV